MAWSFYIQDSAFLSGRSLFVRERGMYGRPSRLLLPAKFRDLVGGAIPVEDAFLSETKEDQDDNIGSVTDFLQAASDTAWELGMRPKHFKDFTNELAAVRYHLEDMRLLAKVRKGD